MEYISKEVNELMLVTVRDLREALMRELNQNKLVSIIEGSELEVMVRKLKVEQEKSIYKAWNEVSTLRRHV